MKLQSFLDFSRLLALYLLPIQLEKLVPQFEKLPPGIRIVSHYFELPGFVADETLTVHSQEDGNEHKLHLYKTDPTVAILDDIVELKVGPGDWPQWGGSRQRNNTPPGKNIPTHWDVGDNTWKENNFAKFNQKLGHKPKGSKNIKWAVKLGSEAYGNPIVANGRIFFGDKQWSRILRSFPCNDRSECATLVWIQRVSMTVKMMA